MTVQEYNAKHRAKYQRLSFSYRAKLCREAKAFMSRFPGCADHSYFWRGLSARQVVEEWSKEA